MKGSIYNILGVWTLADEIDRAEGKTAYENYNRTMSEFAQHYETSTQVVAGIFAALSPVNDYWGNLRSMKSVLEAVVQRMPMSRVTVTTTHPNRLKAWKIATREISPEQALTGRKTRSFWDNLVYPTTSLRVTVDRHALSVWLGERHPTGSVSQYDRIERDYRTAAQHLHVLPCVLQATTWFTWKRLHGLAYKGQLELFHVGNQWRNFVRPADVEAFPFKEA